MIRVSDTQIGKLPTLGTHLLPPISTTISGMVCMYVRDRPLHLTDAPAQIHPGQVIKMILDLGTSINSPRSSSLVVALLQSFISILFRKRSGRTKPRLTSSSGPGAANTCTCHGRNPNPSQCRSQIIPRGFHRPGGGIDMPPAHSPSGGTSTIRVYSTSEGAVHIMRLKKNGKQCKYVNRGENKDMASHEPNDAVGDAYSPLPLSATQCDKKRCL